MKRLTVLRRFSSAAPPACSGHPIPQAPSSKPRPPRRRRVLPVASMPKIDRRRFSSTSRCCRPTSTKGRAPGTKGEDLTVRYLEDQFKKLGLKPGNPDGTYVQKVPLVGITGKEAKPLTITKGTQKQHAQVEGRGGGLDQARGRRRRDRRVRRRLRRLRRRGAGVQLGRLQGRRRQGQDDRRPRQRSRRCPIRPTREARSEDVRRQGDDVLRPLDLQIRGRRAQGRRRRSSIVHETGPAGYPFSVVQGNLSEKFDLVTPDKNMGRATIEGWITLDAAKKLLAMAGQDFDALKKQAHDPRLQARAARAQGVDRDPEHAAHDRLAERRREARRERPAAEGRVRRLLGALGSPRRRRAGVNGDKIYNGALDNASGVATVLEIAQALHAGAAAAEALDPVPDGDGGRAGAARLASTTRSTRCIRSTRPSRTSTSTASTSGAARRTSTVIGLGASDLDDYLRQRPRAGTHAHARSGAGEGLLLPLGSLQLREAGRPGARSGHRRGLHRQDRRLRQDEARRVHEEGLPRAVRPGEAGLGSVRRRRGRAAAPGRRLPRRATPTSSRSGSRATSSRRSATRR